MNSNNVIQLAHLALMLHIDDDSSDRFLTHVNTRMPPAVNIQQAGSVSESTQIGWSNNYWLTQLSLAGIVCPEGLLAKLTCDNLKEYEDSFDANMMPLIKAHGLPRDTSISINPF